MCLSQEEDWEGDLGDRLIARSVNCFSHWLVNSSTAF